MLPSGGLSRCSLLLPYCLGVLTLHRQVNTTIISTIFQLRDKTMQVLKMECPYKYFIHLMVGIRKVQLWNLNVGIARCLPNGRYSSGQWQVLWKFCSEKTSDSPSAQWWVWGMFCSEETRDSLSTQWQVVKIFTTGQWCLLLRGLHLGPIHPGQPSLWRSSWYLGAPAPWCCPSLPGLSWHSKVS